MLRYMGWMEAADLIIEGLARTISQKTVTYDFERLMSGASLLKCSEFGEAIIFNPFVIHGNTPFNSKYARIACNVRFQSCKKPLLQKNTDYLKYFKFKKN